MIDIHDIIHKEHEGKECVSFQYVLNVEGYNPIRFIFSRGRTEGSKEIIPKAWRVDVNLDNAEGYAERFWLFFVTPKENIPLTLVCAMGLAEFKNYVMKSGDYMKMLNYEVGSALEGM